MSKIARKPIQIPPGVEVRVGESAVEVKGPKGAHAVPMLQYLTVSVEESGVTVKPTGSHKQARANWGTMGSLIKNAVEGVTKGFEKTLQIEGIGFRATLQGNNLILNVGFSHPVHYAPREGVTLKVDKNTITVSGINKETVGQTAAEIRAIKKPEPYKGKGIRYSDEVVRRKAGKKVAGASAGGAA